jgi:AcrR family transcriptional regulator
MARLAGQIDLSKNEAILDAAIEVLAARGIKAPMEAIARRASVSKQTIYNHYGSKAELVRALALRRVHEMTAPLETPEGLDDPAQGLAGFARVLLGAVLSPGGMNIYRMAMIASQQMSISTLPVSQMKDASGLINLIRNVAGAIGLACLTTILSHQGAVHYADITAAVSTANPVGQDMMSGLTGMMSASGMADPEGGAQKAYSMLMRRQAMVLSFGDAFWFLSLGCWLAVVMALFVKPSKAPPYQGAGDSH